MKLTIDVENTVTHRDGKLHLDPFEETNSLVMVGLLTSSGEETIVTFDHSEVEPTPNGHDIVQKALDDATTRLQYISNKCKIILIKPGWIDTPMTKDYKVEKMNPDDLALEIKNVILSNKNIRTLTLGELEFKR